MKILVSLPFLHFVQISELWSDILLEDYLLFLSDKDNAITLWYICYQLTAFLCYWTHTGVLMTLCFATIDQLRACLPIFDLTTPFANATNNAHAEYQFRNLFLFKYKKNHWTQTKELSWAKHILAKVFF